MAADGGWGGVSNDSKLKEAKISSNLDMVDGVAAEIAASMFARHREKVSRVTDFWYSAWTPWLRAVAESRSH